MTFRCLAFDTAISTGVAFGCAGETPRAWTVNLGKLSWDERFARTLRMVDWYVKEYRPDLVAVEAPVTGAKTSTDLVGLVTCVRAQGALMGVPVQPYHVSSVRKHFLGRNPQVRDFPGLSRAKAKAQIKGQVIARCRMLGWSVEGDDAADALALLDYALALHSKEHQIHTVGRLFS